MAANKVVFGGNTIIDLTGDNVTASDVATGVIFHLPNGEQAIGTGGSSDIGDFADVSFSDTTKMLTLTDNDPFWEISLLGNGTLTLAKDMYVDLFAVGGGGGGGRNSNNVGGAGGGGYTTTVLSRLLPAGDYTITIGAGGAGSSSSAGGNGGISSVTDSDNEVIIQANGGNGGDGTSAGAAGGSGGGGSNNTRPSYTTSATGGRGGSDGSNGSNSNNNASGGAGQGRTTRAYEESWNTLYAGGGGGYSGGAGGAGGGGKGGQNSDHGNAAAGQKGTANTGGGGGGGGNGAAGGAGGSGIIRIRSHVDRADKFFKDLSFNGSDSLITSIKPFSDLNINRDFELYFKLDSYTWSSNSVILSCMRNEGANPGFVLKCDSSVSDQLVFYGDGTDTATFSSSLPVWMGVKRESGVYSCTFDSGKLWHPISITSTVFNDPIVIGSSIDTGGTGINFTECSVSYFIFRYVE